MTAPRIRALVLDARRAAPSATPCADGLASVARSRAAPPDLEPFGAVLVDSGRYEILFEHFEAHATTRARVSRARGVDVAVVIAGQRNGVAARDLKLLHACGCRRAILVVPPGVPDVVVEHLGRHLLLGARFDADEMPVVPLANEPEQLTGADIAALLDALDRTAVPALPGALLATVTHDAQGVTVHVARGALAPDSDVIVHQGNTPLSLPRLVIDTVTAAGDHARLEAAARVPDGALLAHERLSFIDTFDLEGTFRDDDVSEMCFAFGGDGGFAEGRILRGAVSLGVPIAPHDGRVGLVRFQGAGLGPVQSVAVDAALALVSAPGDADVTPEDARRPAGWTGDVD